VRHPVAALNRRARDERVGRHAPLDRRRVDEGLETRPGLAVGLRRVVELVAVEVVAADHRHDLAVPGVDRHDRALDGGRLRDVYGEPAAGLVHRLDLELGEVADLELVLRLPARGAPHVLRRHHRVVRAEVRGRLVARAVDFGDEPHQVLALFEALLVPVGVVVA
jgi:hypothetical protein